MENAIASRKKTGRLAGLLYLIWIMTGLYAMFYIPSQINTPITQIFFVPGKLGNVLHNYIKYG